MVRQRSLQLNRDENTNVRVFVSPAGMCAMGVYAMWSLFLSEEHGPDKDLLKHSWPQHLKLECSSSWNTARRILSSERPDLVQLDSSSKHFTVPDLAQKIRSEFDIPVVVVSEGSNGDVMEQIRRNGATSFFRNPAAPEDATSVSSRGDNPVYDQFDLLPRSAVEFYAPLRILVVHDNETSLEMITRILDFYDLPYLVTSSAENALEFARLYEPHVVLMDPSLPSASSRFPLWQDLLGRRPEAFLIGVHSSSSAEDPEAVDGEDWVRIFDVPFQPDRLVRTLSHISFVVDLRNKMESQDEKQGQGTSFFSIRRGISLVVFLLFLCILSYLLWVT